MITRLISLVLAVLGLVSCGPSTPRENSPSSSIQLVKKQDGLAYAQGGADIPYTGEVISFSSGLSRVSVEAYRNGRPHGLWQRFWSNGKLKREERYETGAMVHLRQWYEDGTLKLDSELRDGIRYGKIQLWWPNGHLRRTSIVGHNLKPHGQVLEYAEDGTILCDAIFDHGTYVSGKLLKDPVANAITAQAD